MIFPPLNGWKLIHSKPLQTSHSYFIVSTLFLRMAALKKMPMSHFSVSRLRVPTGVS